MSRVGDHTPGTAAAYQAAIKRLISNHRDEYDTIHKEERVRRGLGEITHPNALKERVRELEAKLREAGIEP